MSNDKTRRQPVHIPSQLPFCSLLPSGRSCLSSPVTPRRALDPTMAKNRFSGFDFKDRNPFVDQDPFVNSKADYNHAGASIGVPLHRNKSERDRLQGIQQTWINGSAPKGPQKPRTPGQRFDLWMINEGGKRLFFFAWIFFHCLVIAFGFMNYQLSDDLTTARATFGITYREYSLLDF